MHSEEAKDAMLPLPATISDGHSSDFGDADRAAAGSAPFPRRREVRYGMEGTLRPAQRRALDRLDAVIAAVDRGSDVRVQYHGATGSGKTLIARGLAEDLAANVMVFFAPRIDLLAQAFVDFRRVTARHLEPIVVCSRPDVRHARGFPAGTVVTTDASSVQAALRQPIAEGALRVLFATYHSAAVVSQALRDASAPDLLVFDEAHRLSGSERSAFARVLSTTFIPGRVRLAMTATPLPGMEDGSQFGTVADRYTVGEGIADGVLCDYQVQVLGVRDDDVASMLRWEPDRRSVAVAAALVEAYEGGRMRRILTFHHRRVDAERFADIVRRVAGHRGVDIATLAAQSGDTAPPERAAALARLHDHGGLIASPRIYLEGTDVPSVDTVVFVDPKTSVVDISQGIGRALRAYDDAPNKRAQIVIPVAVAESDSANAVLDESEFRRVWDVLRVLAAQDPRLEEAFDRLRSKRAARRLRADGAVDASGMGAAATHDASLPSPASEDPQFVAMHLSVTGVLPRALEMPDATPFRTPPSHVPPDRAHDELPAFADRVTLRAVEELASRWSSDIAVARAFAELTGDVRAVLVDSPTALAAPFPGETTSVRERVVRLRDAYSDGLLTAALRASVDRIAGWRAYAGTPSPAATIWSDLIAWVAVHGEARVPLQAAAVDRPFALGDHVEHLRAQFRAGTLTGEDVRRLESLPGWVWDLSAPSLFHEALPLLRAFVERFGHARVPAAESVGNAVESRVVSVVAQLRAAHHAGRLHAGDVAHCASEFGLPWEPGLPTAADMRLWMAREIATEHQDAATARSARVRALPGAWDQRA